MGPFLGMLGPNFTEEPVVFYFARTGNPCRKVKHVEIATGRPISESQAPQGQAASVAELMTFASGGAIGASQGVRQDFPAVAGAGSVASRLNLS